MAANVAVTYTFTNGTAADAAQVNQDFTDIVSWINTNAVHLDGSKVFTGAPSYASDPVSANQLCRKSYVDGYIGGATLVKVKLQRAAAQSFTSTSVMSDITWDTEDSDASGFIAAPGATLTVPAGCAGWYQIGATTTWASATPNTVFRILLNGTRLELQSSMSVEGVTLGTVATERYGIGPLYLAVGDTLKFQASQTSGATINLTNARLLMFRISD